MSELKVVNIMGDYASLIDMSGEEITVAIALLPEGIDVGDILVYQDLEFRLKK